MKKVVEFIKNNLKDKTVVLGCSYGPDSMCLLDILYNEKIDVICAHVNHNIRKESKKEMQALKEYCNKLNITFESTILSKGDKSEAFSRGKRLDFLKKVADKYNTNYILTAHHADDLIETILMRITRKSNLSGYSGFKLINENNGYTFVKPLIFVTKDNILEYNSQNSVPFAIDTTNFEEKYRRNRFRKNVLPFLKCENNDVHKSFLKFSEELIAADEYILEEVNIIKKDIFKNNSLDLKKFNKLNPYIKKRLVEEILKDLYKGDIDKVNSKHVDSIIKLINKDSNFVYNLPKDWNVFKEYDRLLFGSSIKEEKYDLEISEITTIPLGRIELVKTSTEKNNYVIRLDSSKIELPLRIRTKKDDDRIIVKNSDYYKKVKKVFIDKKVPKRIRDNYPILVDNKDNILWIPGVIKSKFDVDIDGNYDIILKYTERKN